SSWRDRVGQAEAAGFDVLQVADHLGPGMPAPLPALVAAAEMTSMGLGTYVVNAGTSSPAYLARDVATAYRLTDGRLELGSGAGYAPEEFEAVGRPFGSGGDRLRPLEATLAATRELLAAEPDRPLPPIMLAGAGDRMLRLAAREADVFSFSIAAGMT